MKFCVIFMPMDCCHILLGRPWQFDRHVVYDGRVNKYTAWKDGNSYQGGHNSYKGRGNSNTRGGFHGKCYRCGGEGHRSF